ncbi:primosomal protein N' [Candidatus Peregrinibacteria bacterium HGW-Peregrinibacteria-1]|jgi:primosomal protein N' (replication factor Y)|nr:MAG: primosomal protein N' [Candidatus Peregrinibacteria bacterium HGW-Peregrinibacteria-1]
MFAEILFKNHINGTPTLTYSIPNHLPIKVGDAVSAKIRNRLTPGIVIKIHTNKPDFKTLPIEEKIHETPILSQQQVDLLNWISTYYLAPPSSVLKLFIPDRILKNKPFRQKKTTEKVYKPPHLKTLTSEQSTIISTITDSPKNTFLIQGITGSGKTEIYSHLAKKEVEKGNQVLFLVPEISLTHQMIEYFEQALQTSATVINSKISEGQRYKNWMNIYNNESKLIIGSRSAIFSPFNKLSLIIIDEEHDKSYKQTNSPQYHTHQIAEEIIAQNKNTKLIYGSATPSIETAEKYTDSTLLLTERIGGNPLPSIEIVDLRDEFHKRNKSIFSETLQQEITDTLAQKKQIILFLNRRGSASSIVCRDCGYIQTCKHCHTPQTYHQKTLSTPRLICHHCGIIENPLDICPNCTGVNIRYLGIGTQRIEDELKALYPSARILRADKDTTSKKESFKEIYQAFRNQEADILIGTQMIAKGLHLPNVHLVGVVLADIGLNIPDFRTQETNFQLLTQVAGRAGRADTPGKVIIQTYNPDNTALQLAKAQDYQTFFNYERQQRSLHQNPPFSKIATIKISGQTLPQTQKLTADLENELNNIVSQNNLTEHYQIHSYPAYLMNFKKQFHYIILIKNTLLKSPREIIELLPPTYTNDKNIKINIDPLSIT